MDQESDLIVVDAGMESHYRKGHIRGAVHIPADPLPPFTEEFTLTRISMLPPDRLIITYCD